MLFNKQTQPGDYEVVKEGVGDVIHLNYNNYSQIPSIENSPIVMAKIVEVLSQNPSATGIVFHQNKKYEYSTTQTALLLEIAVIYNHFIKQKKILTQAALGLYGQIQDAAYRLQNLQYVILSLLKTDPIGAFVETKRLLREEKIALSKDATGSYGQEADSYINTLQTLYDMLSQTRLIIQSEDYLSGYDIGTREAYNAIFRPAITPDFMYTRLVSTPPLDAVEDDAYTIAKNTHVQIFSPKGDVKQLYHVIPPEFKIDEDKYELLELARRVLAEHKPKSEEFTDPKRMRETFFNIGRDLLTELAQHKGIELDYKEILEMTGILVRYTIGFGLIETILQDPNVQDISINSPPGASPIFIVHGKYDECVTNIIPSAEDIDSWASKFRLISARPLDEANPVLDTELEIPGARARVAIITRPLNPTGTAFSIRRHRDDPWTLPLFMKNKMINSLAAGLLSFFIDGSRTILVAGTRGSGKTSLLSSILVEIMRKYRIITVEDTLELPVDSLRKLGYNIQSMKVRSALAVAGSELAADEGIRTSLRMGDSSLIVGEIRSKEAHALYEAMRVGALANVVAGTIHGDSPYGVFDRVVNDLNVPRTSFKATDIIVIANPVKTAGGLSRVRRVTQITEVRKEWEDDPLAENGFVDLMKYNAKTDTLEPTDALINGESEIIKSIGGQVKEWAGSWDAIWENIELRARIKQKLVDESLKYSIPSLLEAESSIQLNDEFHRITERVRKETGYPEPKRIEFEWNECLKKHIKDKL